MRKAMLSAINAPTLAAFDRPLIGDGTDGRQLAGWASPVVQAGICSAMAVRAEIAPTVLWSAVRAGRAASCSAAKAPRANPAEPTYTPIENCAIAGSLGCALR